MTITVTELMDEVARLGHWDTQGQEQGDDEFETVHAAVRAGLRRIQLVGAWPWLRATYDEDMVASQRGYAFPDDLFQFDIGSFLFVRDQGDRINEMSWGTVEEIDLRVRSRKWRLASASHEGTPRHFTRIGNEFWLAPRPSADDIPASLEYIYYRDEPATGNLYLPEAFRSSAVHASLAEGLKNRDDTDQAYYENLYLNTDQPNLLSAAQAIGEDAKVGSSPLADVTLRPRGRFFSRRGDRYGY